MKKLDLSVLSKVQEDAVRQIDGPSLVIAGAGSGKTRVLTYKIAWFLENGIDPSRIMALTFTNKAAREMKERIGTLIGEGRSRRLWMGTFHSIFASILRRYPELTGFPSTFTIYDTTDSRNAIKAIIRELKLDEKAYKPNVVASRISDAKNNLCTAAAYMGNQKAIQNDRKLHLGEICNIYDLYARRCLESGVMDFDDILLHTNILFSRHPEVVEQLRERITHILVDEYQDTNLAQYRIIRALSAESSNITVVGDDSQSIYAFRGARIQNILNFRQDYPQAKIYRLERNYRSTANIVEAANSLIDKNEGRIPKKCYSEAERGEKLHLIQAYTDKDEASEVVSHIIRRIATDKAAYEHFAILYRNNAQSRLIEDALRRRNLPYKIYKGHAFYERAEIKDMLAYFRLAHNYRDNEAFLRIVNIPARGLGETTLERLKTFARERDICLMDAIDHPDISGSELRGAATERLRAFKAIITGLTGFAAENDALDFAKEASDKSGYMQMLREDKTIEGMSRLENVQELLSAIDDFVASETASAKQDSEDGEAPLIPMQAFLESVALQTDSDTDDDKKEEANRIKLLTVHTAKGLEFPYVYIIGMEENLFPSSLSTGSLQDIEEERRVFYVALTRAEKAVTLSFARQRFRFGKTESNPVSRFLKDIDPAYLDARISDNSLIGSSVDNDEHFRERKAAWRGNAGRSGFSPSPVQPKPAPAPSPLPSGRKLVRISPSEGVSTDLNTGNRVSHAIFGTGIVKSLNRADGRAVVAFDTAGEKTLLLKYAKLTKIN